MSHSIPTDLLSKLLNYLASKAYSEVHALIAEVQSKAEQIKEEEPVQPSPPIAPIPVKK